MNARELHDKLEYEHKAGLRWLFSSDAQERETILRALRLLDAAEANDGERSQLIEELRTEADLCRNETAEDVAELLEDAASSIVAISALANALKDECNGLAARVLELEALLTDLLSTKRYDANNGRGGEGKFVTMNIRAELVKRADAAIDAARGTK